MKYKVTLSDNSTVEIDCDSEQSAKSEMEHRMQFAGMMGGEKLDVVKVENNETIHALKIAPEYFQEVFLGHKNFEIRKNDRNFNVGDWVVLNEWESQKYTGHKLARKITYVTDYMQQDGYVVFGTE